MKTKLFVVKSKPTKFTKAEQKKLTAVFATLRAELQADLSTSGYNNDLGCPNCGDTGGFHNTMFRLEQLVGLRKL